MTASQGKKSVLSFFEQAACTVPSLTGVIAISSLVSLIPLSEVQAQLVKSDPVPPPITAPISLFPKTQAGQSPSASQQPGQPEAGPSPIRDVKPLKEVDISSLGSLSGQQRKLPNDLWQHSYKPDVSLLIGQLQIPNSRAEHGLLTRLLLAQGEAPKDRQVKAQKSQKAKASEQTQIYIATRLQALARLGALEGGNQLIRALPLRAQGEAIAVAKLQFALLSRQDRVMCQNARKNISLYRHPAFAEAQLLCSLIDKKPDQARLNWQVLTETGKPSVYLQAILSSWQAGKKPNFAKKPSSPTRLRALDVRLMEQLDFPIPVAHLPETDFGLMRLVSQSKLLSVSGKRQVLAKLYQVGLARLDDLKASYLDPALPKDLIKNIQNGRKLSELGLPADQQLSALIQAMSAPVSKQDQPKWPEIKAALIKSYIGGQKKSGLDVQTELLLSTLMQELDPRANMRFLTWDAGKALLLAGEGGRATPWLSMGMAQKSDQTTLLQAARLWLPVAVHYLVTDQSLPSHLKWQDQRIDQAIHAWTVFAQQQQSPAASQSILQQLKRLLILANMKGGRVTARHWFQIMAAEQQFGSIMTVRPASPFLFAASSEAQSGKTGEALLMLLQAIGPKGIGQLPAADIMIVLDILQRAADPSDVGQFLQAILRQIMQDI